MNIYVSAYQFGGTPRRFIELAAADAFRLDISNAILNEMLRVLHDKFQWTEKELREVETDIHSYTRYVVPLQVLHVIEIDPPDNRILECAVAAKSDFIVSGDARHLLPLGSYAGISIVKVSDFLQRLGRAE